jgi:hypothetical protein
MTRVTTNVAAMIPPLVVAAANKLTEQIGGVRTPTLNAAE